MTRFLKETPELQWFDTSGFTCRMCGKPANGILMSRQSASYGAHCKRCADRRLKDSKQVRELLAKEQADA
jgi:transcription elongation factor Elf1